ncbi:hypothetical protein CRUP_027475, partial [Coryphaenoides rupestris]
MTTGTGMTTGMGMTTGTGTGTVTGTGTGMVEVGVASTGMVTVTNTPIATREEEVVMGLPAAPAAVTLTRASSEERRGEERRGKRREERRHTRHHAILWSCPPSCLMDACRLENAT